MDDGFILWNLYFLGGEWCRGVFDDFWEGFLIGGFFVGENVG